MNKKRKSISIRKRLVVIAGMLLLVSLAIIIDHYSWTKKPSSVEKKKPEKKALIEQVEIKDFSKYLNKDYSMSFSAPEGYQIKCRQYGGQESCVLEGKVNFDILIASDAAGILESNHSDKDLINYLSRNSFGMDSPANIETFRGAVSINCEKIEKFEEFVNRNEVKCYRLSCAIFKRVDGVITSREKSYPYFACDVTKNNTVRAMIIGNPFEEMTKETLSKVEELIETLKVGL